MVKENLRRRRRAASSFFSPLLRFPQQRLRFPVYDNKTRYCYCCLQLGVCLGGENLRVGWYKIFFVAHFSKLNGSLAEELGGLDHGKCPSLDLGEGCDLFRPRLVQHLTARVRAQIVLRTNESKQIRGDNLHRKTSVWGEF